MSPPNPFPNPSWQPPYNNKYNSNWSIRHGAAGPSCRCGAAGPSCRCGAAVPSCRCGAAGASRRCSCRTILQVGLQDHPAGGAALASCRWGCNTIMQVGLQDHPAGGAAGPSSRYCYINMFMYLCYAKVWRVRMCIRNLRKKSFYYSLNKKNHKSNIKINRDDNVNKQQQ